MKPALLSKEKNTAKFTMAFSAEEFDAATAESFKANRSRFAVDGFRKGKAPRSIIEKRYGEGVFFEDAVDNMLNRAYPEALDVLGLEPVDRPSIDFGEDKLEKGKGFTVTAAVTVKPEVEIKDYKGIKIERTLRKIEDQDVERELESRQKRNARLTTVEREAKKGDTVILDYTGFVGEEQFEGGTAENQPLVLGSGSFIPGFEDQLEGCRAGDEKDVNVTFPAEYHAENLAGKDAVFKCKVREVKEEELPAIDDEFAKDISEFDTLEELKADIRKNLEESARSAAEYEGKNSVVEKLCETVEIDIPQVMIDDEAQNMLDEFTQQLSYQGLSLDMYCEYLKKTKEEILADMKPDAVKRLKSRLVVDAVAKQEGIEATAEEIEKELGDMAKQYGMEVDKLKSMFGAENSLYLEQDIRMRKAIDFLYENAVIKDVKEKKTSAKAKSDKSEGEKKEPAKKASAKKKTAKEENEQ